MLTTALIKTCVMSLLCCLFLGNNVDLLQVQIRSTNQSWKVYTSIARTSRRFAPWSNRFITCRITPMPSQAQAYAATLTHRPEAQGSACKGFAIHAPRCQTGTALLPHQLRILIVFTDRLQQLPKDTRNEDLLPQPLHNMPRLHSLSSTFSCQLQSPISVAAISCTCQHISAHFTQNEARHEFLLGQIQILLPSLVRRSCHVTDLGVFEDPADNANIVQGESGPARLSPLQRQRWQLLHHMHGWPLLQSCSLKQSWSVFQGWQMFRRVRAKQLAPFCGHSRNCTYTC